MQINELNKRMFAIESLLNRLEEKMTMPINNDQVKLKYLQTVSTVFHAMLFFRLFFFYVKIYCPSLHGRSMWILDHYTYTWACS